MTGQIGILNVGAGDTKLTFDKNNPAECIRSARIVTDMLRRGYALLVEIERDGKKAYERVREFKPDTCEYIIADFDPIVAQEADQAESGDAQTVSETEEPSPAPRSTLRATKRKTRAVHASSVKGIAVARTAGG